MVYTNNRSLLFLGFGRVSWFRRTEKNQDSFGRPFRCLPMNEKTKIRSDGLWTNGGTKIRSWASKERRMEKPKDSFGWASKERKTQRFVRSGGLPKNGKPQRFVRYPTVPSVLDF
ncbi:unnamed protein product [Rhizophagus irregularis]|nr:unnamed protein product [Rhizophagus irregularis]